MSAAWAKESAERGVTVNVLLPGGATDTRIDWRVAAVLLPPDIMNPAILWLCSMRPMAYRRPVQRRMTGMRQRRRKPRQAPASRPMTAGIM